MKQMSPSDLYLHATINRYRLAPAPCPLVPRLRGLLEPCLGRDLESVTLSGSRARGTALRDSDVDLFLSLAPSVSLKSIHAELVQRCRDYLPQPRNVSVRITFEGSIIDLVPGRRRPDSTAHTLWQLRYDTWLQTDIAEQTRYIRSSGLSDEILALKIWRRRHALRFPSFLLELAAIRALAPGHDISKNFLSLLEFLAADFPSVRLLDPANSNNVVSDSLTLDEKLRIATAAAMSLRSPSWSGIF